MFLLWFVTFLLCFVAFLRCFVVFYSALSRFYVFLLCCVFVVFLKHNVIFFRGFCHVFSSFPNILVAICDVFCQILAL